MDASFGIAYNLPRYMGSKMSRGAILLLAGALAGCALFAPSSRSVYQQGRTVVQLEKDPTVGGTALSERNTHPATIKPTQLVKILDGVLIKNAEGLVNAVLGGSATAPVFTEEELASLAPILSKGLAEASPSERVAFTFWSTVAGRRLGPFSGSIAVQDPYLIFRLKEHPAAGWQDPENPPPPSLFALDFRQGAYLKLGSEDERKGSYRARPTLQIDYRRYLAALDGQSGSPPTAKDAAVLAPSAPVSAEVRPPAVSSPPPPRELTKPAGGPVADLQRQVKELTDSNQELRSKLREMRDRQNQSQAVNEELARLRQDLAEAKQLLADKVLELNRLKNKSRGSSKGKK